MSKVKIRKVSMKNFLSFGNVPTVVTLDSGVTFGIIGDNRDIGGEGSSKNGVGKTSIYSAIIYGVFGKSIDKLKADEFINITNGNKMVAEVEFSKNGVDYLIKRGRKPNFLSFHATVDGETTDLTRDSMSNTDKDIEKTIGMTYDIFMSTVFLSPHREAFYEMGAPAQRNIIEQMLSLDVLSERAEALKVIRTDLMVDIKVNSREIELYEGRVSEWETRKSRLTSSTLAWDNDKSSKLESYAVDIHELQRVPVDEIAALLGERDQKISLLSDLKSEHQSSVNKINAMISTNTQRLTILNDISKLEDDEKETTSRTASEMATIEASLEDLGDVSMFKGYIDSNAEYKALQRALKSLERDLHDAEGEIERGEENIAALNVEIDAIKLGKCPTCGNHYEDDAKIAKSERALIKTISNVSNAKIKVESTLVEIEKTKLRIDNIDEVVKTLDDRDIKDLTSAISSVSALEVRKEAILSQPKRDYQQEVKALQERLEKVGDGVNDSVINELQDTISSIASSIDNMNRDKNVITDKLAEWNITTHLALQDIKNKITNMSDKVVELKNEKNPHKPELTQHNKEKPDNNDELEKKQNELNEKVTHSNYLIKLLTDSKSFIRRGILDRYIPFLNQKINGYLQEIGLSHVVEVSTDLNVDITYMTKNVSYYNLSRGERLRLNIATTLAFRDLMKMIGKSSNLLLIDEVLDSGLDQCGIIAASELLQKSADDVFLITHRSDLMDTLDKKLTVIKENGFTRIELN